ncbi:HemK2/MTQ2 family protein methyltransferase [Streptomyces sp. NBC_00083]|uniref:HemK2/MTQ2 family protein methyltransferase n=1 Tax=Streptomyces sp. NBC_00083 TaxID=2975647 RepID=UPI0022579EBD|nr:HemK2/MTQ2 family protein methyltransferase [Streptomyces sp. NBC_00083]MCX5384330.1 methyltransferase [Streptomyces sp. NBC_00083]
MTLIALPGVYDPQDDTDLLADALHDEAVPEGAEVLDIGTGTGALALAAARLGARVTAVDISWRAVISTRLNARLAGVPVRVVRGDLLSPLVGRSYDLILSNPPYVPALSPTVPGRGAARAWDAGHDGRLLLRRICRDAPRLLRPGGVLLIVHSALSDPRTTLAELRGQGLKAAVADRRFIPFGPVLRSRRDWLVEQGLISDDDTMEELVVIRAERPV